MKIRIANGASRKLVEVEYVEDETIKELLIRADVLLRDGQIISDGRRTLVLTDTAEPDTTIVISNWPHCG